MVDREASANLRGIVQGGLVMLIGVALHASAVNFAFVYDDLEIIVANPWLREPGGLAKIFTSPFWSFGEEGGTGNYYRPLLLGLHWLQYRLFGLDPAAYHFTNVLVHGLAVLLVFALARRVLGASDRTGWASFAGAALFAVHPVHIEAVCWVSGISDLLASSLVLVSLYIHIRWRDNGAATGFAVAFCFAACLVKETAFVLPFLVMAYETLFGAGRFRPVQALRCCLPFAAACVACLAIRAMVLGALVPASTGSLGALLSAPWLLTRYLGLLVLPVDLNVMQAFEPVDFLEPRFVLGVVVAVVFAGAGAMLSRSAPVASLGFALVLVPILPVLNAAVLTRHPFAERYLYLPSVGLAVIAAWAAALLLQKGPRSQLISHLATGLVLLCFASLSAARMAVWHSELSLWEATAIDSPRDPIARYNLGRALLEAGRPSEALVHLEEATQLRPRYGKARNNLGVTYAQLGRIREAAAQLELAASLRPSDPAIRVNFGKALLKSGSAHRALEECSMAIEISPTSRPAARCVAQARAALGPRQ